ncbi:hypothetical protein H6G33_09475 [Calothrix sp. FACHB-1219]|uniref:hypothetical protein n=1 Tax=unclassified Calothrix TaxID=2619626 RepID=UPI001689697F|nr:MULTISPECIES: hypothetical protein [unclassified Calothrix]MBD2201576.1 hypothetical protein [Calothrix sp. FACHB-168]MBD2217262.1 hypothetical protein [Calothrix sp. FACHB-1219]
MFKAVGRMFMYLLINRTQDTHEVGSEHESVADAIIEGVQYYSYVTETHKDEAELTIMEGIYFIPEEQE